MKLFESWKQELKKKSAISLAMFMLCGSVGSVFAQEPSGGDITLFDSATGDSGANGGDETTGNVKTITGYQTERAVGYAANIEWGQMLFVYDRGQYDPTTGQLIAGIKDEEGNARTDIEYGGNLAEAGKWYGFDGVNNSVKIENLSTEAIYLTAIPDSSGQHMGDAQFTLYTSRLSNGSDDADSEWTSISEEVGSGVSHAPMDPDGSEGGKWSFGAPETAISRSFAACKFNADGSVLKAPSDRIYLNISGTPSEDLITLDTSESNDFKGEALGTITLNFATATSEGLEGSDLSEINGDSAPQQANN